jgi:signal transduction histidine kinase
MELRIRKWFYLFTLIFVLLLIGLGSWWLYLVFQMHATLTGLHLPQLGSQERFLNMMRWEGSFFFILLMLLGGSLFYMYFRDMKKSKSMQAFFASLSHELKTPLASMRLQAEVIKDLIEDETHSHDQLSSLTTRLIEDTHKLESELEKSLQLSRIENGGSLTLVPVSLDRYLRHHQQKLKPIEVITSFGPQAEEVMADELALNAIFRNLFENTIRHNPGAKTINISANKNGKYVEIIYDDNGPRFSGNREKLGTLFYKHNSTKGSGLGLYLIKNLMLKMNGGMMTLNREGLVFRLTFQAPPEKVHV